MDAVCDNTADYEMQYENAANVLVNNKVQECEFFKKKSGVSKWDSYSEDEKEKAREYFQEYYVQNPVGDLTCEKAWAQFVEYLKNTDSNA